MTQQGTRRLTKIELIRLRKRLTLASKIRRILKDRLSILVMEFLAIAKETVEAKQSMLNDFSAAYKSLSITAGYHGYIALGKELSGAEKDILRAHIHTGRALCTFFLVYDRWHGSLLNPISCAIP